MFPDLYEYLILFRQLNVPGIGTFNMERKPAETDFTHKLIQPPAFTFTFNYGDPAPVKSFFFWLSNKWNIPFHEAVVQFNGFALDLKSQVKAGHKIIWDELGTFSKGLSGEIMFEPLLKEQRFDPPVSAVRIIRNKAEHSVRVGEQERTSVEMSEWIGQQNKKNSPWWAPSLIAFILLIIVSGFYFSQNGCSASSAANQQQLSPKEGTVTYQLLP